MKQVFKKSLALILAMALPMQAFAEQPIWETDYFPEKHHTELPYNDLVFTQPDLEGAETVIAAIEPLLDDPANTAHVGRLFEELDGVVRHGVCTVRISWRPRCWTVSVRRWEQTTATQKALTYTSAARTAAIWCWTTLG